MVTAKRTVIIADNSVVSAIIVFLFWICVFNTQKLVDAACVSLDGQTGQCVRFEECRSAVALYQKGLTPAFCNIQAGTVCCPDFRRTTQTQRIPVNEWPSIVGVSTVNTKETFEDDSNFQRKVKLKPAGNNKKKTTNADFIEEPYKFETSGTYYADDEVTQKPVRRPSRPNFQGEGGNFVPPGQAKKKPWKDENEYFYEHVTKKSTRGPNRKGPNKGNGNNNGSNNSRKWTEVSTECYEQGKRSICNSNNNQNEYENDYSNKRTTSTYNSWEQETYYTSTKRPNYFGSGSEDNYPGNGDFYSSTKPNRRPGGSSSSNFNNNRPGFQGLSPESNNPSAYPEYSNSGSNRPNYPENSNFGSKRPSYPESSTSGSKRPNYPQNSNSGNNRPNYPQSSNSGSNYPGSSNSGSSRPNYPEGSNSGSSRPNYPGGSNSGSNRPNYPESSSSGNKRPNYPQNSNSGNNRPNYPNSGSSRPSSRPGTQKRKSKSEQKCEEYSKQVTENITGLPLTTDPDPVTIPVRKCITPQQLIVGGENTTLGEFPHMAAVGFRDRNKKQISWNCGGTLISELFVLTAGHCTSTSSGRPVKVRLGEYNLKKNDDGAYPVDYAVVEIITHPEYKPPSKYNDIALLKLSRKVTFFKHIRPACLYSEDTFSSTKAIATGWGRMHYDGGTSEILQKVVLSIVENNVCDRLYKVNVKTEVLSRGIIDSQLCAGELTGGKDTCQGDSGGPLSITSSKCIHHIIGITSFGKSCALPNSTGVYTRVSSYIPWIESVVWPSDDE